MILERLLLSNFRNYISEQFEFHPQTNIIFGQNAEGKTNVLEAIYLLSTLQTFRSIQNRGLIHWDQTDAQIEGILVDGEIDKKISVTISADRKKAKINDDLV